MTDVIHNATKRWDPSMLVEDASSVADIINGISFGRSDAPDYQKIRDKLASRGCHSVATLTQEWDLPCLKSLIRSCELKKDLSVYIKTIGSAICHDFYRPCTEVKGEVKGEGDDKRARGGGGDMRAACTKVEVSEDFNASKYLPDGRCFEVGELGRYAGGEHVDGDPLPKEDEYMLLDAIILDLHANPEPSCGDYLPEGLPRRLASVCNAIFPQFAADKAGKPRGRQKVITLRAQNGRNGAKYPRMVLSEEYKDYVQEKSRDGFMFVPPDSEMLTDNPRNTLFGQLIAVYRTQTLPPMVMTLPEKKAQPEVFVDETVERDVVDGVEFRSSSSPPTSEAQPDIDPVVLDGVALDDSGGNESPPKMPPNGKAGSDKGKKGHGKGKPLQPAKSKKDALKQKRAQGVGSSGSQKPTQKKPKCVCCPHTLCGAGCVQTHCPNPAPPCPAPQEQTSCRFV